jgi:uncharacterized protein YegP (UPF0339 family)
MKFYIYTDGAGYWRWRLQAGNNRIVADSGEGYFNRDDCLAALVLVMNTNRNTPVYNA